MWPHNRGIPRIDLRDPKEALALHPGLMGLRSNIIQVVILSIAVVALARDIYTSANWRPFKIAALVVFVGGLVVSVVNLAKKLH